jgi:serine/threonine-protein kinase
MISELALTLEETLARALVGHARTLPVGATLRPAPAPDQDAAGCRLGPLSLAFLDAPGAGADADLVIVGLLGEGGMGTVHLARQRALGREVAVKVARRDEASPHLDASLVAEAMLLGSLEHPNIVPVHALGADATGRAVLVMKRVEGVVWRDVLEDPAHPAWSRADLAGEDRLTTHLQILMQVANALEYAHSRGVVHRDVKPENVMLGAFGEVYLLDWGVAWRRGRAQAGAFQLVGTPGFLAPEMVTGNADDVDARTDVYLLGATLHCVLTGRPRHDAAGMVDALAEAIASKPAAYGPEVPAELAALGNAATSRDKDQRPPSAAAFRQAIAAYLRHRSSNAVAGSARANLELLDARLAAGTPLSGVEVAQRMAECRFGFLEALRAWGGNEAARRGLDACLARMVEREIEQRNPPAARALLADMAGPDAALAARIERLEEELRAAREREERSAHTEREMDASVAWAPRVLMLSIFLGGVVVATVVTTLKEIRTGMPTPMSDAITADVAQVVAVGLGIASTGRQLLANQYNRRVIGVLIVATVLVTVIDVVAWWHHLDSRTANLIDSIALTACFTVATQGVEAGWWRIVVVWVGSALLAGLVPPLASAAVSMATVITVVVGIQVARRSAARAAPAAR